MGLPKTVRLEEALEERVEKYLANNEIKFSQLINMAVEKFISELHTIELKPVDTHEFLRTARKAFKKHKDTMDKLK
jgi:hypothetical protein